MHLPYAYAPLLLLRLLGELLLLEVLVLRLCKKWLQQLHEALLLLPFHWLLSQLLLLLLRLLREPLLLLRLCPLGQGLPWLWSEVSAP
jgi:hypothetical protein